MDIIINSLATIALPTAPIILYGVYVLYVTH